jgi:hypothetical protein
MEPSEVAKQKELKALAELIRLQARIKNRVGVYQRDLIAEVRDEREQDDEYIRRGVG